MRISFGAGEGIGIVLTTAVLFGTSRIRASILLK